MQQPQAILLIWLCWYDTEGVAINYTSNVITRLKLHVWIKKKQYQMSFNNNLWIHCINKVITFWGFHLWSAFQLKTFPFIYTPFIRCAMIHRHRCTSDCIAWNVCVYATKKKCTYIYIYIYCIRVSTLYVLTDSAKVRSCGAKIASALSLRQLSRDQNQLCEFYLCIELNTDRIYTIDIIYCEYYIYYIAPTDRLWFWHIPPLWQKKVNYNNLSKRCWFCDGVYSFYVVFIL